MKTVFTSREIAHIWAHQSAPYGRSPGNASFDGDAFKSYATVIARRIAHKGKVAYVLDSHGFSNSTSKVQGRLRCALDHATTFHVDCGSRGQSLHFTPATLRDYYVKRSAEIAAALPSRYARIRAEQYMHASQMLETARGVCIFYGLPHKALDSQIAKRQAGQETAAETLRAARQKALAAKANQEAKDRAERKASNIAKAEKFLAEPAGRSPSFIAMPAADSVAMLDLPWPLRAELETAVDAHNVGLLARWDAGEDVSIPYDAPVRLRVSGDEMETSKGARVPLTEARKAYMFANRFRLLGWHRNGETFAIGGYQLDAVNESGIVAGCHRVSWEECDRFARSQGWVQIGGAS